MDTLEALLEAPALLRRLPIRPSGAGRPVVGVVTTTGGGAAMVVDQLGIRGIDVQGPGAVTSARLAASGIDAGHSRILDLTLAGTRYEVMKAALDAMLADPAFDLVVAVAGSSARFQPELAVRPIIDSAGEGARLAAFLVPEAPDALQSLAEARVPAFRTPEACADAIAAALGRRMPTRLADTATKVSSPGQLVDELAAYRLLSTLGIAHAPCAVFTGSDPGVPYPVAVKLLSDQIAHKSDIGGVVLCVTDPAGLADAAAQIRLAVALALPGHCAPRLMVQQMASGVGEALLGYRIDPQAGPLIVLAAGGIATELYRDRSIRLAPVDLATAHDMINEVKGFAVLREFRGRPPGDLRVLAVAIVALSQLAAHPGLRVVECEINPLIVKRVGEGVLAVDACAWLEIVA